MVHLSSFRIASSNKLTAKSASSIVIHMGGFIRNTFPKLPPLPNNKPLFRQRSKIAFTFSTGNGLRDSYTNKSK